MASTTSPLPQTHDLPGKPGAHLSQADTAPVGRSRGVPGSVAERRLLRRIPVLRSLSARELEDVQERMTHRSYQAGEVLWRTHGPLRFSGYVESGEIDLETRVAGALVRTMRLCTGDTLPSRAVRGHRPHESMIARAVTDVRLAILPDLQEYSSTKDDEAKGMIWLWPVLLLLLVVILARDDIARITSGLFYLASTRGAEAALQDSGSMRLLKAAQKVDRGAAFAYNEEGYRWFMMNHLPAASAAFNEAVSKDPANTAALNNLAITYFTQGDLSQTASTLQRAMEQDSNNPIPRYNLGITLMQLGNPVAALGEFREAGFIDSRDVLPLLQQAYLYQQVGDYANAEQRARSAIQLNPSLVPAHLLLGIAIYSQGRETEALDSFDEALVLEPGNRVAAFYQALIQGHQKQFDAALPVLHELLATSADAAETARILAEIDALYRFKTEPSSAGP